MSSGTVTYINAHVITMVGGFRWKLYATNAHNQVVSMLESCSSYVWEVDCLMDMLSAINNISDTRLCIYTNYQPLIQMYYGEIVTPLDLEELFVHMVYRNTILVGD